MRSNTRKSARERHGVKHLNSTPKVNTVTQECTECGTVALLVQIADGNYLHVFCSGSRPPGPLEEWQTVTMTPHMEAIAKERPDLVIGPIQNPVDKSTVECWIHDIVAVTIMTYDTMREVNGLDMPLDEYVVMAVSDYQPRGTPRADAARAALAA